MGIARAYRNWKIFWLLFQGSLEQDPTLRACKPVGSGPLQMTRIPALLTPPSESGQSGQPVEALCSLSCRPLTGLRPHYSAMRLLFLGSHPSQL